MIYLLVCIWMYKFNTIIFTIKFEFIVSEPNNEKNKVRIFLIFHKNIKLTPSRGLYIHIKASVSNFWLFHQKPQVQWMILYLKAAWTIKIAEKNKNFIHLLAKIYLNMANSENFWRIMIMRTFSWMNLSKVFESHTWINISF